MGPISRPGYNPAFIPPNPLSGFNPAYDIYITRKNTLHYLPFVVQHHPRQDCSTFSHHQFSKIAFIRKDNHA